MLRLPARDRNDERRRKTRVPAEERHRPTWQLALEMVDELRGWGLSPPVILADAAYGDISEFRLGLAERALDYVVQMKGGGKETLRTVVWREGSRGQLRSRFLALRVRPASVQLRRAAEGELALAWLVCECRRARSPLRYRAPTTSAGLVAGLM